MAEHYSELEVAHSEHVEPSPEVVNYSAFSPERASLSHDSPEVISQPTLAALTNDTSPSGDKPEVHKKQWPPQLSLVPNQSGFDNPGLNNIDSGHRPEAEPKTGKDTTLEEKSRGKWNNRFATGGILFWVAIGSLAFVAVLVGIGVGVGVGIRNKNSKQSSQPAAAKTTAGSVPLATPGPSDPSLTHGLIDGTSLAIVALDSGDKRLFIQENSGNIREALFDLSTQKWTSDVNNVIATNARNNTPVTAFLVNTTESSEENFGPTIWIFYISENNQLASRQFLSGTWTTRDNFSPTGSSNSTFRTANDTRALAVTSMADSAGAYVFYVAQNGTAVALRIVSDGRAGITASAGPKLPTSIQADHVLGLAAGVSTGGRPQVGVLSSNGTVYYSLYFSFLYNGSWSNPQLQTLLVPPLSVGEQADLPAAATSLTLENAYPATATSLPPLPSSTIEPFQQSASYNETLLGDVNIAQVFINTGSSSSTSYTLYGFWVNGTSLAAYTTRNIGLSTEPKSSFPYSRLAGTTVGNSSDVYLYHQINETAIAEDVYDTDGGFFTTKYLDIEISIR